MTDNNGIFANDQAYAADEQGGRDKRTVLVAGGLAALVLGAGAFFFLGSGSDEADTVAAPSAAAAANAKARAAKAAAAIASQKAATTKIPVVIPAESSFAVGRNPFTALYVAPVTAPVAAPVVSTPAVTPTSSVPTTGGTTYIPPVTTPVTKPTTPAVVLHKLVLKTVSAGSGTSKTMGTFVIDKKKYVVPVGQVFGPTNELVVVAYQQDAKGVWTAVLRVGDSAPFDALQGDPLNVM